MQKINEQAKQRVSATIMQLMDGGGTLPAVTYDFLIEESPAFWNQFPKEELFELCVEIQLSDVPEESRRFHAMFDEFNRQYFSNQLAHYDVRVVYDIGYWAGPAFHDGALGLHQPELQQILIRRTDSYSGMVSTLIYEMARVTSDCDQPKLLAEIRRLRKMGTQSKTYSWIRGTPPKTI